jgi:hypothetical protein
VAPSGYGVDRHGSGSGRHPGFAWIVQAGVPFAAGAALAAAVAGSDFNSRSIKESRSKSLDQPVDQCSTVIDSA